MAHPVGTPTPSTGNSWDDVSPIPEEKEVDPFGMDQDAWCHPGKSFAGTSVHEQARGDPWHRAESPDPWTEALGRAAREPSPPSFVRGSSAQESPTLRHRRHSLPLPRALGAEWISPSGRSWQNPQWPGGGTPTFGNSSAWGAWSGPMAQLPPPPPVPLFLTQASAGFEQRGTPGAYPTGSAEGEEALESSVQRLTDLFLEIKGTLLQ